VFLFNVRYGRHEQPGNHVGDIFDNLQGTIVKGAVSCQDIALSLYIYMSTVQCVDNQKTTSTT